MGARALLRCSYAVGPIGGGGGEEPEGEESEEAGWELVSAGGGLRVVVAAGRLLVQWTDAENGAPVLKHAFCRMEWLLNHRLCLGGAGPGGLGQQAVLLLRAEFGAGDGRPAARAGGPSQTAPGSLPFFGLWGDDDFLGCC